MKQHSVFLDKNGEYYVISHNSLEYTDYLALRDRGHMTIVKEGNKRECQQYVETMTSDLVY